MVDPTSEKPLLNALWNGIETAPEDEFILGFNKFFGVYPCMLISDGLTKPFWISAQNLEYYYNHGHTLTYDDVPTHWMQLPEPPQCN